MQLIQCQGCGANNRPQSRYCMRCGKPISAPECAATRHARAFVGKERQGPFFGAYPEALDFSVASLAKLDALISELWGTDGMAPGAVDWQPPASKLPLIVDLGAYLGEVLCGALALHWEMDPRHPEVVIAARVVDAQGRRVNPFAQMGARFRDGAGVGMASLYTALSGRALPAWRVPHAPTPGRSAAPPAPVAPGPPSASAAPTPVVDPHALHQQATAHLARGHAGNAVLGLRQVLAAQPANRAARIDLVRALAQAGETEEALREAEAQRRLAPADLEWTELRAQLLAQAGRLDEALGLLDMALMKQPAEPRLLRRRAFLLLKAQRWARAQAELVQLQALAEDAEQCIGLAHALAQQGQSSAARAQLEHLLAAPMRGRTAQLDAAARERLAALAQAGTAAPSFPPAAVKSGPAAAEAAYAAAIEHARGRRFEEALPHFLEAARLQPSRAACLKDVGNCLHDLGRSSEAAEWFRRCLALAPGMSAARRMLGVVEEKLGRRAAAIDCYREVLARLDSEQGDVDRAYARLQALGAVPG